MVIKRDNGKAPKKAPSRSTSKAQQGPKAKPLSNKTRSVANIDVSEKDNPVRDPTKFPNRYCELVFPLIKPRNYHVEPLLAPPAHIIPLIMPRIEQRQWEFLLRKPREANLSWVSEFYTNYHSPSLTSVLVRRRQVPVTEEGIQNVLKTGPLADGVDAYQEILLARCEYAFDWDAILKVIATPESFWIQGRMRSWPKGIDARFLTREAHA